MIIGAGKTSVVLPAPMAFFSARDPVPRFPALRGVGLSVERIGAEFALHSSGAFLARGVLSGLMRPAKGFEVAERLIVDNRLNGRIDLNISDLNLKELPPQLWELTHLCSLNISGNHLRTIDPRIGQLTELRSLVVEDCRVGALPEEIGLLTKLEYLSCAANFLDEVPRSIANCQNLSGANFGHNNLSRFPDVLLALKNLQSLVLSANRIESLPAEIRELTKLRELLLLRCALRNLPPEIGELSLLEALDVGGNLLTCLPNTVGRLRYLTHIDAQNNQLVQLNATIGNLYNLRIFNVRDNSLTSLPTELGNLENLQLIDLRGNALPDAILERAHDLDALLDYLRELARKAQDIREVKLVLVGSGETGKTCLLDALQDKPFAKHETTLGFDVLREAVALDGPTGPIKFNCWDFGGQDKYEITHQFFFSPDSVYLLIWKPRTGRDACRLEEWLDLIGQRAGKQAPVIIVATHADEIAHTAQLEEERLMGQHPGIRGFVHVSSEARGTPFEHLKKLIYQEAEQLIVREVPASYASVRSRVLRSEGDSLTFGEFRELCSPDLRSEQAIYVAQMMHRLGDIVYFQLAGEDADENRVILKPQWLGKAIGHVIDDEDLRAIHDGVVENGAIARVWAKRAEDYGDCHYEFFLWMMEQYSISHRLESDPTRSLLPQLIQIEKPIAKIPWGRRTGGAEKQLTQSWAMNEAPPKGLVVLATVRAHALRDWTRENANWKGGFYLEDHLGGMALVELRDRRLEVSVRAPYPVGFMRRIRELLEKLIREQWPGLDYEIVVPCPTPKCEGTFEFQYLIDQLGEVDAKDQPSALETCRKCRKKFELRDLVQGYSPDYQRLLAKIETIEIGQQEAIELQHFLFREGLSPASAGPVLMTVRERKAHKIRDMGVIPLTLDLYCEEPGFEHCVASLDFEQSAEWLNRVAKPLKWFSILAKVASKGLVPMIDFLDDDLLPDVPIKELKLGSDLLEALPDGELEVHDVWKGSGSNPRSQASMRVMQDLLESISKRQGRQWGGLTQVVIRETSEIRWVCEEHAEKYANSLPRIDMS